MSLKNKAYSGIWGFIVGDAMGVPHEFRDRASLEINPVSGMTGGGIHDQPPGTWSDDTSMMLCVLENNYNYGNTISLAQLFLKWYENGHHTAHGKLFDIGETTQLALERIRNLIPAHKSGLNDKKAAGNGSLMRSLPYAFMEDFHRGAYKMVLENKITHRLSICHESCLFYVRMARSLAEGRSKDEALKDACLYLSMGWRISDQANEQCKKIFSRLFSVRFSMLPKESVASSGYVIETLESAIWCFMNGENYESCVLKAVNLGVDTDTIAALTGGLAGIYYGFLSIPLDWKNSIYKKDKLDELIKTFLRK